MNKINYTQIGLLIVYFTLNCIDIITNVTKSGLLFYLIFAAFIICVLLLPIKNSEKKEVNISGVDIVLLLAAINTLSYITFQKNNIFRYIVPEIILLIVVLLNVKYQIKSDKRLTKFSFVIMAVFVICLILFY